jgi:hypothetical protein
MKNLLKTLVLFGTTSAAALVTAFGQNPSSRITVDEFGVGTYFNGTTTVSLQSGIFGDPFNGGTPHLAYILPFNFGPAPLDIALTEPGQGSDFPSDLLRVVPSGNSTLLYFYSDVGLMPPSDPSDAPADNGGIPTPIHSTGADMFITETGLFGNGYTEGGPNGGVMFASAGQNGSDGNPAGTSYTFVSENGKSVPEPSTWVSLASGAALLALTFRRRRSQLG